MNDLGLEIYVKASHSFIRVAINHFDILPNASTPSPPVSYEYPILLLLSLRSCFAQLSGVV